MPGVTGRVVYAQPAFAEGPLTNAAAVAGNLCLVDRGGGVTYGAKVLNAQNAGATAVIFANDDSSPASPSDDPALTATITIPSALISQADGNAIKAVVTTDANSPVNATLTPDGPNVADWVPSYTARGPRRNDSVLKPDVTAPAEVVVTAANGSGTGAEPFSGTSSSTPHVAGAMALMRQLHPTWTVEQLKALVMNTADFDLFSEPGRTGPKVGPGRIGAGRMDLATAAKANVVAYTAARPLGVSVSYGAVDVPVALGEGTYSRPQFVNVVNKGTTPVTYAVSFTSVGTDVPGVSFSVPAIIRVPAAGNGADGTTSFPVTLNAVPNQMRHTHDPSITPTAEGTTRQWLAEATGYVVLTPNDGSPTLRLAVHAAPRPASDVRAATPGLDLPAASGTVSLDLVGTGVDTGEPSPSYPTDILSLGKTLELQYVSPRDVPANVGAASADLKHVGVISDYAAAGNDITRTVVNFGVATHGDHAAPDNANARIDLAVDPSPTGDFSPKHVVTHFPIGPNIYAAYVLNVATGAITYDWYLNVYPDLDTNIFNNSVLLFPVSATSLGLTATGTRFRYQVQASYNGALIDQSPVLTYDPAAPGLVEGGNQGEPFLDTDAAGTLTFGYNAANLAANRSRGLMVTHLHNAAGARSEAVPINPAPTILDFQPPFGPVGRGVAIHGQGFTRATAVRFSNGVSASFKVRNDSVITTTVPAGAVSGPIRVETPAGAAVSQVPFKVGTRP